MSQGSSGLTSNTSGRLVLDAGVIYYNINVDLLKDSDTSTPIADAQASGTLLGATRGGSTLTFGRSMRRIELDGFLGPAKRFKRRQSVSASLTTNLLEVTSGTLQRAYSQSSVATAGAFQRITGAKVSNSGYLDNIVLFATYASEIGVSNAVVIVMSNVLATESPTFEFVDEAEASIDVRFDAHFASSDLLTEPWAIYFPRNAAVTVNNVPVLYNSNLVYYYGG